MSKTFKGCVWSGCSLKFSLCHADLFKHRHEQSHKDQHKCHKGAMQLRWQRQSPRSLMCLKYFEVTSRKVGKSHQTHSYTFEHLSCHHMLSSMFLSGYHDCLLGPWLGYPPDSLAATMGYTSTCAAAFSHLVLLWASRYCISQHAYQTLGAPATRVL